MLLELPDELLLHITDSLERDDIRSLLQTHTRLFYLLIDRYHLYDKYGQAPLIIASAMGHMKVIRRLLVTGVDTATRNVFGQTALLAAATTGHEAVIELLLTVGNPTPDPENEFAAAIAKLKLFDRNSENLIGQTPLSVAAERGHEGAVKLLIAAHGIEPDHKDVHGRTPLALASASGHQVVVKLLLATNRVDPDSKDSDGRTPLSTAAQNWHEKVVRLLLMARVDPTSKDTSGLTPLDWAKRGKRGRWNERVNQDPVIRLLQVAITERDRKKPSVYRPLLSIAVLAITIWSFW